MSNLIQNLIILSVCWLIAISGGIYTTYFHQPEEMDRLEKAEQVARMKQAELSSLMAEMSDSESMASSVVTRWDARYKIVPATLGSEDIVSFLNEHTRTGFRPFDIVFENHDEGTEYNKFEFSIEGRGDFNALYRLVWAIENDRQLFRIKDLELTHFDLITDDPTTEEKRLDVMVSFVFTLEAFYGGTAGLSASDNLNALPGDAQFSQVDFEDGLLPVPEHVLPARNAIMNPFHPLILESIPPNTYNRVDIEEAELLSIIGTDAVLLWNEQEYILGIGDAVYLGQIISVDPRNGLVTARLNKGGIMDQVELSMDLGELYKQARGSVELSPTRNN